MCLINSSLGSTVQLFLSLSWKCLHRVTANQGNVCGKNQADCLWMISRELKGHNDHPNHFLYQTVYTDHHNDGIKTSVLH